MFHVVITDVLGRFRAGIRNGGATKKEAEAVGSKLEEVLSTGTVADQSLVELLGERNGAVVVEEKVE
jgi:hypothetical protein